MRMRLKLVVIVETEGDYYFDPQDLKSNVIPWIEGALEDRDDVREVLITGTADVVETEGIKE